jgi:exopolysaccharide biosynthesis polyprenyl glycosylphosphotransferase
VIDIVLAATLLVALAPVLLLLALLVRLTSRGPVLYVQERMGIDTRPFRMLKFRTMRWDAEAATGPVFSRAGDPRATPLGRGLRRFSLDELPQLWNVLRGDMSLVGPRPEREPFIEQFRRRLPGYMLRHTVKSGMTGWAQVHGFRGDSSLEDRLRYDLEYVDRWSLSLDVEILGRTAFQVLAGRNAH